MNKIKLKEAFDVESKHGAFYTGGNLEWHGNTFFCQGVSTISLLNVENGVVEGTIGDDSEDADSIQTFTCSGEHIITSHKSGLLKLWSLDGCLQKMWKYIHKGPIARLCLKTSTLASGGSDGVIRIWDLEHHSCILSLKGCIGVVHVVEFHPEENLLFGSGDDGKVNLWNLQDGKLLRTFTEHFSKVTSIAFCSDKRHFVTSGRDKVLVLWDFQSDKSMKTIPVYESIECVIALPKKFEAAGLEFSQGIYVATGGENGVIRVWDVSNSKEVYRQTETPVNKAKEEGGLSIIKILYNEGKGAFAVVTVEQDIVLFETSSFKCVKQFVGFADEILDATFVGKNDSFLAVATNSIDIKLYENSTMNCQLLKGHTDLVLAVCKCNTSPDLFASSGKDNSVRVWRLMSDHIPVCVSVGKLHTGSVGSIAFSQTKASFLVSASQDTCVKVWEVPTDNASTHNSLTCLYTQVAHEKDINCVAVSPNDKIIATASQDKTAKLWSEDLQFLGTLRGHKRGVWCVCFSLVDQVVLTGSADCTVKLWSAVELNCLKTIEGHESSVLRASFIGNCLQILTAGADGLVKMFSLKTCECVTTLDEHRARIWALALKSDESGFVTGGADSLLIKWKDVTKERQEERKQKEEELALQEQQLSNYVHDGEYLKALKLALRLNRPSQTLKIIQAVMRNGDVDLTGTIADLEEYQKEQLLKCVLEWNTNSRYCHAAQLTLNVLLDEMQKGRFKVAGLSKIVEGALPYTERHFKRITQLLQDLHFIKYTIHCIQPHSKVN